MTKLVPSVKAGILLGFMLIYGVLVSISILFHCFEDFAFAKHALFHLLAFQIPLSSSAALFLSGVKYITAASYVSLTVAYEIAYLIWLAVEQRNHTPSEAYKIFFPIAVVRILILGSICILLWVLYRAPPSQRVAITSPARLIDPHAYTMFIVYLVLLGTLLSIQMLFMALSDITSLYPHFAVLVSALVPTLAMISAFKHKDPVKKIGVTIQCVAVLEILIILIMSNFSPVTNNWKHVIFVLISAAKLFNTFALSYQMNRVAELSYSERFSWWAT